MKESTKVVLFLGVILVLVFGLIFILIAVNGPGHAVQGGSGGVGI
jgi:hypothetical protein